MLVSATLCVSFSPSGVSCRYDVPRYSYLERIPGTAGASAEVCFGKSDRGDPSGDAVVGAARRRPAVVRTM